jgi:hypothetical protein
MDERTHTRQNVMAELAAGGAIAATAITTAAAATADEADRLYREYMAPILERRLDAASMPPRPHSRHGLGRAPRYLLSAGTFAVPVVGWPMLTDLGAGRGGTPDLPDKPGRTRRR